MHLDASDAGTDIHTEPARFDVLSFAFGDNPRILHGLPGGGQSVLCE